MIFFVVGYVLAEPFGRDKRIGFLLGFKLDLSHQKGSKGLFELVKLDCQVAERNKVAGFANDIAVRFFL